MTHLNLNQIIGKLNEEEQREVADFAEYLFQKKKRDSKKKKSLRLETDPWTSESSKDILKQLGDISIDEVNYYKGLS